MSHPFDPNTPAHADRSRLFPGPPPLRAMQAIEDTTELDRLVDLEQPVADAVLKSSFRRRVLQGQVLGHPVHPPLTDLPIGFWLSSTVLDLGGAACARGADRLLALGIVSALPTALTGLADWGTAARTTQRVGVVHAAANSVALTLYVTSLVQRKRGRRRAGVVLSLLAGAFLGTGGFLGGHLMVMQGLGRGAGHNHGETH